MAERDFAGGVKATADRLAKKQNDGWTGSRSIHPAPEGKRKKRLKQLRKREKQAA